MRTHIALLKGINVGGNNMIKMADLRQFFIELGFQNVATLLQSGNVVFSGGEGSDAELESRLRAESSKRLHLNVSYLVRSENQLRQVIAANPFVVEAAADPSHLLVHFLPFVPLAFDVDRVQSLIAGPERIKAGERHLYVLYPDGIGASTIGRTPGWNKLTSESTARNWNTILKLDALLRE